MRSRDASQAQENKERTTSRRLLALAIFNLIANQEVHFLYLYLLFLILR